MYKIEPEAAEMYNAVISEEDSETNEYEESPYPINLNHECKICKESFRLSKCLFEHQVKHHRGSKISDLIQNMAQTERYYSSDSECEYTVTVEVVKTLKSRQEFLEAVEEHNALEALNPQRKFTADPVSEGEVQKPPGKVSKQGEKFECPLCAKQFTFEYSVKEHVKFFHVIESGSLEIDVTRTEPFDCPVCGINLKNLRCLRKHLKMVHNLVIKGMEFHDAVKIPIEEYPYLDDHLPRRKQRDDVNMGAQRCELCGKICNNAKTLRQHIKLYHMKEAGVIQLDLANMQQFFCPECDKNVKTRRNLRRHLRLCHNLVVEGSPYTGEPQVVQTNTTGPTLVRSSFSKEFPIYRERSPESRKVKCTCGICGYGPIIGHSGVIDHQVSQHGRPNMHSMEPKLFICHFCTKKFTHRDNIIKHLQTHLDRKYVCELCSAKFKTLNCLKKHRTSHVSIKCGLCPLEFHFRKDYKAHHRNDHSNRRKIYEMIEETPNEIIITSQDEALEFQQVCCECGKVFYSKQGLMKHSCRRLASDDVAELVCAVDDCEYITTDATGYLEHQTATHAIPIVMGKYANTETRVKGGLLLETCPVCSKNFRSKRGLLAHNCKTTREVKCPFNDCGQHYTNALDYHSHVREVHNIDPSHLKQEMDFEVEYEIVDNEIVGSEVIIS